MAGVEAPDPSTAAGAGAGAAGGDGAPPFVPGACAIVALDPATLCEDPNACPVEVAGEVDCAGEGGNPSVAWDGAALYATLDFATGSDRALLALRVDADATTHDVHVIEHVELGLVRLDRGAPVLLTVVEGQLVAQRADPTFTTFEAAAPRALALRLWDAGYDDAGDLHVFERGEGGLSELAVDGRMIAELASEASAAIAPEGGTAVAFAAQSAGQSTLQLWRSETDTTSELAPPMPSSLARLAVVPYSLAPNGWLTAWDAGVGMGIQVLGTPQDGRPGLGGWSSLPSTCSASQPTSSGGSCPDDGASRALGTEVLRHGLLADAVSGPWLLSLVADTTELCTWVLGAGCFESVPCSCNQQAHRSHGPTTLVLRSIAEQVTTWRLPIGASPDAFAFTALAGGAFFVVTSTQERSDAGRRTRLRYLRVRLARGS